MATNIDLLKAEATERRLESQRDALKYFKTTPVANLSACDLARSKYDITRVLLGKHDGVENEVSRELASTLGRQPQGVYVPMSALFRSDLSATTSGPLGQDFVTQDATGRQQVDLLRKYSVTARAGVTTVGGLVASMSIPRQITGTTPTWLPENSALSDPTNTTWEAITISPKRASSQTVASKQVFTQSLLDMKQVVVGDMVKNIAVAQDNAVLLGLGSASNQPLGIFQYSTTPVAGYNWVNLTSVSSGAPTWAQVLSFEEAVEASNSVSDGTGAYIASVFVKNLWKQTPKNASSNVSYLWESNETVNGYRGLATNQLSGNQVVFSNRWSDVVVCHWGVLDIVVDEFTAASANKVIFTVTLLMDVYLKYGPAFCIS